MKEGQSIANHLTKGIQTVGTQLKQLVTTYNSKPWDSDPKSFSVTDISNPMSSVWSALGNTSSQIPHNFKVQLVALNAKRKYAAEEEEIVVAEMANILKYRKGRNFRGWFIFAFFASHFKPANINPRQKV